jgi:hypothetical protein
MTHLPTPLDHLGPSIKDATVEAACKISENSWNLFYEFQRKQGRQEELEASKQLIKARQMCIAEATSTAIRHNTTWLLLHPSMSLLRDRYEQVVRFSWLIRQTDDHEFQKYFVSAYAKINKLFKNASPSLLKSIENWPKLMHAAATAEFSKEEREFFSRWESLDLLSMATKRDSLPPISESKLGLLKLGFAYKTVYQQFSSVTHYNFSSLTMLKFNDDHTAKSTLAANSIWPSFLCFFNAYLDLIQCYEAGAISFGREYESSFIELNEKLHILNARMIGLDTTAL